MGQAAKSRVANGGGKGGAKADAKGSYWSPKNKKKPKKVKEEPKVAKSSSLRYVLLGLLVALISVGAGEDSNGSIHKLRTITGQ